MTRSLAEEAADPKTTPQRMRELIQTDRSLYATVACNPNVDEPLRQWLWVNGGRDVQEAMVQQYEDAMRAQKEASEAKDADESKAEKPEAKADKPVKKQSKPEKPEEKKADEPQDDKEAEAKRQEAERLAAERAEAERRANEEAARLETARLEAERLEAERKAVQARLDAEKAENERLNAEAARADEERRLAEQRKMAAELAAIQAEAQAFTSHDAADSAPAASADDDDAESTVVVNRSKRPPTRLITAGGQSFELTRDVVILGRKPRGFLADSVQIINVKDTERTISKTHARLSWHDDAWYISDLGSTNGVSVGFGNSKIELTGSEEVQVTDAFALGLHEMNLKIAQ